MHLDYLRNCWFDPVPLNCLEILIKLVNVQTPTPKVRRGVLQRCLSCWITWNVLFSWSWLELKNDWIVLNRSWSRTWNSSKMRLRTQEGCGTRVSLLKTTASAPSLKLMERSPERTPVKICIFNWLDQSRELDWMAMCLSDLELQFMNMDGECAQRIEH